MKYVDIEDFVGKTFVKIIGGKGDDELVFIENTGKKYTMYHEQNFSLHKNIIMLLFWA